MQVSALVMGAVLTFVLVVTVALFVIIVLPHFLSDAQRYGIDERGNAKTPAYLAEEKRREQWHESFSWLPPD